MFYLTLSVGNSKGSSQTEIKSKIAVSNKCYYALGPILKRRSISQSIKICLSKTIIRPTMIYGAETWAVSSKIEKMLMTWERKILRKLYGPTKENGQWRIKTNPVLITNYKSQDIMTNKDSKIGMAWTCY